MSAAGENPGGVTRASRTTDGVALALVVAGAGAYFFAWRGMQALAERRLVVAKGENLIPHWETYYEMSRVGVAGMAAGALVAVWSYLKHRKPAVAPLDAPQP